MNVPKIRFKEFKDDWKNYKIGDVLDIINGLNKEKEFFGHGTPIINYMDVNKNEVILKDKIKGLVELNSKELNTFKVKKGDILFTRTSETSEEIGLTSSVAEEIDSCVFSGFILKGSQKGNYFDSYYGGYYFRNPIMRNEIIKHSSITTRALTSAKLLNQMNISIPTLKEQQKIGRTFYLLDKKIDLQTQKLNSLKILKKHAINSLLKKGELKEILISEVGKIITGTTPSKAKSEFWDNGNISWITPTDIDENRDIINSTCKLTESGLKQGRFIPKDSILVTCIASIGKNAILKVDGSCNQQINAIVPYENFNPNYVYYLMESISNYMKAIAGTSATAIINKEEFSKIKVKVHDKKEQDRIDKILSAFENKIIKETEKLDLLMKLKKGLMQNMFV